MKAEVTKTEKGFLISGLTDEQAIYLVGELRYGGKDNYALCVLYAEKGTGYFAPGGLDELVYFMLQAHSRGESFHENELKRANK